MALENLAVQEQSTGDKNPVFNALQILASINDIGKKFDTLDRKDREADSAENAKFELSNLLKRVDDHWESKDQKLYLDEIEEDEENAKLIALEFNSLLSQHNKKAQKQPAEDLTDSLEIPNIFSGEPYEQATRNLKSEAQVVHESKNRSGERTTVSATKQEVLVEKKDADNKQICSVHKSRDKTTVKSGPEQATISNEETVCTGKGCTVKVKRDGKKQITTNEGLGLTRNPDGNAEIRDGDQTICSLEGKQLHVGKHHHVTFTTTDTNLAKATEQIRERLRPDQTGLLVIKNVGNRLIFGSGTTIDVKGQQVRIKTKSGDVVSLEARNGKFYIKDEGGDKELNKVNCPDCIKVLNGKFLIDGIEIDSHTFRLTGKRINIDFATGQQTLESETGEKTVACTDKNGCTQVRLKKHTVSNEQHSTNVRIRNNETGSNVEINLDTKKIQSDIVTDTSEETVIRNSGTKIHKDGSVEFNDGKGPILFEDGSVRVDNDTYISKDMDVTSGDWQHTGHEYSGCESAGGGLTDVNSITNSVYAKALAGTIKWSDISELNICAGHLFSLMATLHSDCPLLAKIKGNLAQVLNALSFAAAKTSTSHIVTGPNVHYNPDSR